MFLFLVEGQNMYLNTSAMSFLHTNYSPSFPTDQGLTPIYHTINKCSVIILLSYSPRSILFATNYYIVLYVYFWLFLWKPTLHSM